MKAIRAVCRSCQLLLSTLALSLCGIAQAAIIGPDVAGYTADTAAPHVYEDISASGTRVLAGADDAVAIAAIGFEFSLYDIVNTTVFFSSNGLLTFGEPIDTPVNLSLTSGNPPPLAIAPLWDDWDLSAGSDAIYHETRGTPGVDLRFIVQWRMIRRFPADQSEGTVDFQAVLFENGAIEFRYADVDGLSSVIDNNGGTATIGIKGAAEAGAPLNGQVLQIAHEVAGAVQNGQTIRIVRGEAPSNLPPVCDGARPSRSVVPANLLQAFTPITITDVNDPDGNNADVTVTIDSIFQDERTLAVGSGLLRTCPDGAGLGTDTAQIRAERVNALLTGGNGRVYTISFTATDPEGGSCTSAVKVCVPAGLGGRQCVEDNLVVDSTACR